MRPIYVHETCINMAQMLQACFVSYTELGNSKMHASACTDIKCIDVHNLIRLNGFNDRLRVVPAGNRHAMLRMGIRLMPRCHMSSDSR